MSELSLYTLNKQIEEIMENADSSNINQISTDNIEINYDKGVYYVQYTGEDYSLGDKTLRSGNEFIMVVYNSVSGLTNNEMTYLNNYSINKNDEDKFNNFYYREIILKEDIYSGYLSYSLTFNSDPNSIDVTGSFYWTRKINNKDIDLKNINAKTLDGKYASDFASFKHFDSIGTMRESQYEGGFLISGNHAAISGYSFHGNKILNIDLDNVAHFDCYMRLYCNDDTWYLATDYYNDDDGKWTHNDEKKLEFQGHKHTKEDITDFPTSLPADGGNADTVGNKSADEFALADHIHNNYLEKDTIISIKQGGTGATTASSARTELGLGEASTREITTGISSGSSRVPTSDAVYRELQKYVKVGSVDFLGKTSQYITIEGTDFNTITGMGISTIGTEDGTEMSDSKNQPAGAYQWGTLAVFASGSYGLTQVYYTHNGDTYVRGLYGDTSWKPWKKCGENANSVNKITKTFTVQTGSWYRLATNNLDACGGVFVLTVGGGGASSTTVFSAAQQYSMDSGNEKKISVLSHSGFNSCVTQLRLVNKYGSENEQYIDFYVENGTNGATGDLEVQFFGKGWTIKSSIATSNIADGYIVTVIEL